MDGKNDAKSYTGHNITLRNDIEPISTNYTAEFPINHPKSWVERLEDRERRHFGTSHLTSLYETFVAGWRAGLLRAFLFSFSALVANIGVYAWLFDTYPAQFGTATVYTGSCSHVKGANIGIHAGLNVLSTLILSASTYTMQGLTAPTRREVNKAHAKGTWVEIGAQSLRNLRYVRKRSMWYWGILGITSLPLHLIYNSVFFSASQANQYAVAVVSPSFFTNNTFKPTADNSSPSLFKSMADVNVDADRKDEFFDVADNTTLVNLLLDVRNISSPSFVRMDPWQCIQNYTQGFQQDYSDVVVVSSQEGVDSPILFTRFSQRSLPSLELDNANEDPYRWVCRTHEPTNVNSTDSSDSCTRERAEQETSQGRDWRVYGNPVDHCLARVSPNTCQLQFNQWLMLFVVVFGTIKVVVIFIIWWEKPAKEHHARNLRTLGDAIASFLEDEDHTTADMCLVSSAQIRKHGFKPDQTYPPQRYDGRQPRWWMGANRTEFFSAVGTSTLFCVALGTALSFAIDGAHGGAFNSGIGKADVQSLVSLGKDDITTTGIVPTLLVANIPQLGFSLLYVAFNTMFSKLLVAHEFDRMTVSRKGLRVSERPRAAQRESHFFTLPARYALPLMAFSALLHWLTSQSLFMVRIDGVNNAGIVDPQDRMVRLGYNATGMIALISVTFVATVATLCLGAFRRLRNGLGETSMSVVVSAACHVKTQEPDLQLQEVQWGDVGDGPELQSSSMETWEPVRHCSFTARPARRPFVGQLYA